MNIIEVDREDVAALEGELRGAGLPYTVAKEDRYFGVSTRLGRPGHRQAISVLCRRCWLTLVAQEERSSSMASRSGGRSLTGTDKERIHEALNQWARPALVRPPAVGQWSTPFGAPDSAIRGRPSAAGSAGAAPASSRCRCSWYASTKRLHHRFAPRHVDVADVDRPLADGGHHVARRCQRLVGRHQRERVGQLVAHRSGSARSSAGARSSCRGADVDDRLAADAFVNVGLRRARRSAGRCLGGLPDRIAPGIDILLRPPKRARAGAPFAGLRRKASARFRGSGRERGGATQFGARSPSSSVRGGARGSGR